MAGPTKKEIEKIMRDPNSPERKVYDKFLKGNPLFPDLDKKDSMKAREKRVKDSVNGDYQEKEIEKRLIKSGNKKIKMKKGGKVKKCRMDGIALRGKTRAKERSK
jgi:hypothetical protein